MHQYTRLHNRNAYTEQFISSIIFDLKKSFFLSDKLVQTGNTASSVRTVARAEEASRSSHTAEDSHSLGEDSKTSDPAALLLCQHSARVRSNYQRARK